MFSIFLLKQVKYFLADKNTCVILCEFLITITTTITITIIIVIVIVMIIIIIIIIIISNSNWTEWSTIQGVIARVISKSD